MLCNDSYKFQKCNIKVSMVEEMQMQAYKLDKNTKTNVPYSKIFNKKRYD